MLIVEMTTTFRTFASDYANGTKNEHRRIPIVNQFFNTTFERDTNLMASFDYFNKDKTIFAELKTRNIAHNRWPTALIGQAKVNWADKTKIKNTNTKFYFVWEYTDGIYYLEYDKEEWKDFERGDFQRHARADINDYPSPVVYVPHQALKKLEIIPA
jgi:hypothetical protein